MKHLFSVILMMIMMSVLVACADQRETGGKNTQMTEMSQSKEDASENGSQSTEAEEDTTASTEEMEKDETRWVSATLVNFRETPGNGGEIIRQLPRGTELVKISEEGEWLYVGFEEVKGYIHRDYVSDYLPYNPENGEVSIVVKKSERRLELWQGGNLVGSFSIGLGWAPEGHKQMEGDGKTPEGEYYVCIKNSNSSFYLSLGVSYPNKTDAAAALKDGRIDQATYERIASAIDDGKCPDWYTPLGGCIMIHGCGGTSDWTAGCMGVENEVMDILFDYCSVGTKITILP